MCNNSGTALRYISDFIAEDSPLDLIGQVTYAPVYES